MDFASHLPRVDSKDPTDGAGVSGKPAEADPASSSSRIFDTDSDSIVVVEKPSSESGFSSSDMADSDTIPNLVADDDDEDVLDIVSSYTQLRATTPLGSGKDDKRNGQLDTEPVILGSGSENVTTSVGTPAAAEPEVAERENTETSAAPVAQPVSEATHEYVQQNTSVENAAEPIAQKSEPLGASMQSSTMKDVSPSTESNPSADSAEPPSTSNPRGIAAETAEPAIADNDEEMPLDRSPALEIPDRIEDEMKADLREARTHVVPPEDAPAPETGILEEIWNSVFTPGVNSRVQGAMNMSFAGLFVSLTALAVVTGGNLHVIALIGIAGCLFASVQWFLRELAKMPPPTGNAAAAVDTHEKHE